MIIYFEAHEKFPNDLNLLLCFINTLSIINYQNDEGL